MASHEAKIGVLQCKMHEQEKVFIRMEAKMDHLTERVSNGMSVTLKSILDKMNDEFPNIKDNSWWINKVKWAIAGTVIGGLVRVAWSWVGSILEHVPK